MRKILAKPQVQAYVIELGINDLKSRGVRDTFESLRRIITRLLETTTSKIAVSLVLPNLRSKELQDKTDEYNSIVVNYITDLRNNRGCSSRVFTIFNANFIRKTQEQLDQDQVFNDGIHVSDIGTKMLCNSLKYGLLKAFNIQLRKSNNNNATSEITGQSIET